MKRIVLPVALLLIANAGLAGLTYRVESVSTGIRESTLSGDAEVDGPRMRLNIERGDGVLLMDGSLVLSDNGGRSFSVFDPSTRTYFEVQLDQLGSSLSSLLNQFGGLFKLSVLDPKVSVRDLGAGEPVGQYPTHHTAMDSSYTVAIEMMGQKTSMNITATVESWSTDRIPVAAASFLQTQGFHTGIEDVDKVIAMHAGAAAKGFPLKQTMNSRVVQNGSVLEMKTSTRVSDIVVRPLPASEFAPPAGYTKTDNPFEKMLKAMPK